MKQSKFEIKELLGIGFTLLVLGIGIAYGLDVMDDVQSDMVTNVNGCNATARTDCPTSYNATNSAIEGVSKIPEKLPTIATVVVASVIIGILVTSVSYTHLRAHET